MAARGKLEAFDRDSIALAKYVTCDHYKATYPTLCVTKC